MRKTNDSGSPLAAAAPCARKYLRALCTHACTADVCTALALRLHCSCTEAAAPNQATGAAGSSPSKPPVFLLGRQPSENQSHQRRRGRRRQRGLKAWSVIKRRFRGRYEMGGSAELSHIGPHEAPLDSCCRVQLATTRGGWQSRSAIFGTPIAR